MLRNRLLLEGPPLAPEDACKQYRPSGIHTLKELEYTYIKQTLALLDNNYSDAAKKLGISRSTLWRKIKEYKIEGPLTHEN
jgi:DNA-binding NtrC family response regulator